MSEVAVQKDIQIKVDSPSHNRNIARAVQDQEELDQLMKDAGRSPEVETQEDITEEHPLNKVETKGDDSDLYKFASPNALKPSKFTPLTRLLPLISIRGINLMFCVIFLPLVC